MKLYKKLAFGLAAMGALASAPMAARAATISIACGAVGVEFQLCKEGADAWAKKTGNKVSLISMPNSSSDRLALYQQLLSAHSSKIDVLQIDVVWPGLLGNYFINLKPYAGDAPQHHFKAIIENNTVHGKLVAMPWFTDAGVLYYRKDLLEKYHEPVPKTWKELATEAKKIQDAERAAGHKKMWGFVWQGRAYEGLTCDALEWVYSYGGGTIINRKGKVTIDNPKAIEAIKEAASWVGNISPEGVLNYQEEDARGIFQSGDAVFMRNWPYAWRLAQSADSPVKGKVGIAALPKGGPDGMHAAALGGWQLAVSKFSKHPKLAASLVMYLTSEKEQKMRAIKGSFQPTIPALYKDKEVLAANPFYASLYEVFRSSVPRPSTVTKGYYNRVSTAFWDAVHNVLAGQSSAKDSLAELSRKLKRMSHGGRW